MSIVESTLQAHLPALKRNTNGWLTMNCPVCVQNGQARPDTKHRGGIKFEEDRVGYHCFNCGYTTGWRPGQRLGIKLIKFMRAIGIDEGEIQRLKIQLWDQVVDDDENTVHEPFKKPDWPEIEFPWEIQDITLEAAEYLDSRKVLELTDWLSSPSSIQGMNNRAILPFFDEGKLVGYNARWIGEVPKGTAKIIASRPASFVFNLDRQSQARKYTLVVEGEYDALSLDGVAIMTNSISPEQAKIIEDIDNEPVVLPDRDKAGLQLAMQAAELGWSVSFPDWPDGIKDANEAVQHFGRVATLQSVISAIETSPLKIKLIARRWCA
jgi:hypothetical protein